MMYLKLKDMKKIKITNLDYIRLSKLVDSAKNKQDIELKNIDSLFNEIKRAEKIDSKKISPKIITMNSVVKVLNEETKNQIIIKVVYPEEADFKKGFVSILSPLGTALLGYEKGDKVFFNAPKGKVKITIQDIKYQPESEGEYLI